MHWKNSIPRFNAVTMASNLNLAMRRIASTQTRLTVPRPQIGPQCIRFPRSYSTDTSAAPPVLIPKLKTDLKTAMRAKDAPRLAVLRTLLAAITNASKTSNPIETDSQLVALMVKSARMNQEALDEAKAAKREDLVDKEDAQLQIITNTSRPQV